MAEFHNYGFDALNNEHLKVTLVEAGERILPALPERISKAAHKELNKIGVNVLTKTAITSAEQGVLNTKDGQQIRADLMVRSEEHTSELQSRGHLVCRLLLEKKNTT